MSIEVDRPFFEQWLYLQPQIPQQLQLLRIGMRLLLTLLYALLQTYVRSEKVGYAEAGSPRKSVSGVNP
mgnify:CR=1 FL=1